MQKKFLLTTAVYNKPLELTIRKWGDERKRAVFIPAFGAQFIKANFPEIDFLEYPSWDEYKKALSVGYYSIVGISFYVFKAPVAFEMAKVAREYGVKEVWAGGYGTILPDLDKHFDRVFKGYGEDALSMALYDKPINQIKHPVLIARSSMAPFGEKTGYLFVIRGCNLGCQYCCTPFFTPDKLYIPLSEIQRVLDEYKDQGVDVVSIMDDNLFLDEEHVRKTINLLSERNLKWMANVRADSIIGKVEKLTQSGLVGAYLGVESFSNETLKDYKKRETTDQIDQAIKELKSYGCYIWGTYMFCEPNATIESTRKEIEHLASLDLDLVIPTILTPYPGTPLFKKLEHLIIDWNWRHYDNGHIVWKHPHIRPEQVKTIYIDSFATSNCAKISTFTEPDLGNSIISTI